MTATASMTPNANGVNERNHAVVDSMMDKMLTADVTLTPKVALCWAITAANVNGFSPAQLVFGRNPVHPALERAGPAGLEEVDASEEVAAHIHAMHLAREAYVNQII